MGMDARGRAARVDRRHWRACPVRVGSARRATRARGRCYGADAACEQSVMADAVKTCWQDMDEEAADELAGREPHDLLPRVAIDAVILVLERDAGAVAGKQAAVGDGDAVGISRQIGSTAS